MNLKQLRQFAGDDVAQDAMDDLALELQETRTRVERLETALRGIREMADEDLRLGNHPLQTSLHQIEADARAALDGVLTNTLTPSGVAETGQRGRRKTQGSPGTPPLRRRR